MLIITVEVLKQFPFALPGIYLLNHCAALSPCFFIHFKCFKNLLPLGQGFSEVHLELLKTGYAARFCL